MQIIFEGHAPPNTQIKKIIDALIKEKSLKSQPIPVVIKDNNRIVEIKVSQNSGNNYLKSIHYLYQQKYTTTFIYKD